MPRNDDHNKALRARIRTQLSQAWEKPGRTLRDTEFARRWGVSYATVRTWRKKGRLPQARGGGAGGAPVFIPEDATVLDGDLAAGYPPGLGLVLHWYRHAATSAQRGYAISRAINGLPPALASCFLDTVARWEEGRRADA